MAKVKGFNPPVTEQTYEDTDGILHYFGEFFRMVFGEGSVSPTDPDIDFIGKSRRGARPTEQGEGTEGQERVREAFKNCTLLWNSLPEECVDADCIGTDPESTSKKKVWDAKIEHGVTCSYYDLFMKCCIKHALGHDGAMPEGDCFPCPTVDPEMSWDYANSIETLAREGSGSVKVNGLNAPFTWTVSGTGFSLLHETTSGLTNTLLADGTACGSAQITVTGCDGQSATGYVRCTTGQWVYKGATCELPGPITSQTGKDLERVLGNKKQTSRAKVIFVTGKPCDNAEYLDCNICLTNYGCNEVDSKLGGSSLENGCLCMGDTSPWLNDCCYMSSLSLSYYEWEC